MFIAQSNTALEPTVERLFVEIAGCLQWLSLVVIRLSPEWRQYTSVINEMQL